MRSFDVGGTARQPSRLVIGDGETVDAIQASGEWLSAGNPVEIRQ